ncbi:MAG: 6-bladed beta-propeller [Bacteroidales bacterium]|nr:6-bladed beta-propeller [Bacteroidales bacterium]
MKNYFNLRTLGLVILLGCAIACSDNKAVKHLTIDMIGAVNGAEPVKLSEYASDIEYLPLELKDSAYLYSSMNMFETPDSYVFHIGDKSVNEAFYEFDKSGKYMRSVGHKGRANGEFTNNFALCYDAQNNRYGQLDSRKFIIYNSDGTVMTETALGNFRPMGFPRAYCINGIYIINSIKTNMVNGALTFTDMLYRIDAQGQLLESKILSDTPTQSVGQPQSFGGRTGMTGNGIMLYNNDTLSRMYRENGTDTIKCLNPNTLEPYTYYILKGVEEGVFMQKLSYMENGNFIFMEVMKNAKFFPDLDENEPRKLPLLHNKSNNTSLALAMDKEYGITGFVNDIDGGIPFWPKYVRDNKMFKLIDADEFVELAAQSKSEKMKEIAATLNEESNPVLVVVTLK